MCIAIDEVQFLTDSSDASGAVIRSLIEEGRKYGMGIIIVTHAASGLSRQIIANASAFIAFYAREPSEAGYVAKVLAGNDAARMYEVMGKLRALRQHEAIMVSCSARNPLLVSTPRIKELGAHLRLAGATPTRTPKDCSPAGDAAGMLAKARKPIPYGALEKEYGAQAVEEQVKKGALSKLSIEWQGRDETWLMARNRAVSIEHRVYVQKIHELLDLRGIRNYATSGSNGPDIVARCGNCKAAIEYETGRKPLRESADMIRSRLGQYGIVIVLANSGAYRFYKGYFEDGSVKVFDIAEASAAASFLQECAGSC
jgi:hypothetical protein